VPHNQRAKAMGVNVETQTRSSVVGATIGFTLIGLVPLSAWTYSFSIFAGFAVLAFFYVLLRLPETRPAQSTADREKFELTRDFKKLLLLFVFLGVSNALILPIYMIYLQDHFTSDPRMLSFAFLPSAFVFMFLPSRLGAYADKRNPRVLLPMGMLFAGCFYFAMPLANSFVWIVVLYSVSVLGWALIEPTRKSLTASLARPDSLARSFGLAEMAFGFGATLGPLIGGYLYDNISQTSPFLFNGAMIFATAGLSVWLFQMTTAHKSQRSKNG
jgi:predicted MFS family arabinose efflux permease